MVKEMKNEFEEDRKKMKQVQKAKHNQFQVSTLWSLLVLFGPKVKNVNRADLENKSCSCTMYILD